MEVQGEVLKEVLDALYSSCRAIEGEWGCTDCEPDNRNPNAYCDIANVCWKIEQVLGGQ